MKNLIFRTFWIIFALPMRKKESSLKVMLCQLLAIFTFMQKYKKFLLTNFGKIWMSAVTSRSICMPLQVRRCLSGSTKLKLERVIKQQKWTRVIISEIKVGYKLSRSDHDGFIKHVVVGPKIFLLLSCSDTYKFETKSQY